MGDGGGFFNSVSNTVSNAVDSVSSAVSTAGDQVSSSATTFGTGYSNAADAIGHGNIKGALGQTWAAIGVGDVNLPRPDTPSNPAMPSQPSQAQDTVSSPNMDLATRNARSAGGTIFDTPTSWNDARMRGANTYGAKTLLGT